MGKDRIDVLGVGFDNLTRGEAAAAIIALARSGERGYVVKPYSEFLPKAAGDERIRAILNSASLCLADGVGIVWAAHYLSLGGGGLRATAQLPLSLASMAFRPSSIRRPLRQAMRGVDLTWEMLRQAADAGLSIYILGGTEEESRCAVTRIAERNPALTIVGARHGYFGHREDQAVIEQINAGGPSILLVARGFPKQERWIAENLSSLQVGVAVAEGGSLSFISGATPRAPGWMRRAGIEWLYRLLRQPWRLRRQLALPLFVWLVFRERLRRIGR
jgi:N-acetylglucosaminyldiphosphoundecaprenol N-acetyl-beta-D-mannosaminyltransferase